MADDALFIGWGEVVRGREQRALEVFGETVAFWQDAQGNGRVESFEPCLLQPHGGGLAGYMLIRGERTQLDALAASDEFNRLVARANAVVDELGVMNAFCGEALARQMGFFQTAANELATAA
ncbi:MAG TPA: hypothetical protein VFU94_02925 [Conexibacter sp.]|nr:hypothetical protein [Conexibacter sp.]